jgi:ligand-binding SRPBCC domain-containing protein
MATYERRVRVDAPLADVWDFHSTIRGLEALTPDWMHLRVEKVIGPDGERDPEIMDAGSTAITSVQPLGVGPRQRWISEIVERREADDFAVFRDVMSEGPFAEWEHTHAFYRDGDGTVLRDTVSYQLRGCAIGRALSPLGRVGLEPMFRYRHRKTKELLE